MRAAAILGLGCSEKDLRPFQEKPNCEWIIGLPGPSSEADAILVFGGDGTVHRHLGALVKLGLPVLVVPRGSGNDFARALGLRNASDALSAWQSFASGRNNVHAIDLGVITPVGQRNPEAGVRYFCCVGGVGLDAEVARRANQLPRWLRRRGGYVLSLPPALIRFSPLSMKIGVASRDTGFVERSSAPLMLAAFANASRYGGGMQIAPRARLDDGLLDICLVRQLSRLRLLGLFPSVYFGRHLRHKPVEYFQASRLQIETEKPLDVYADGEYVCQTPIEVSIAGHALRVIVPPSAALQC